MNQSPAVFTTQTNDQLNPTASAIATRAQRFLALTDRIADITGRSVPQIVDLSRLRTYSPGTLGHCWAEFLDRNQLQPLTSGPRRKQLHDGVHVLTGYGTDTLGEAEVQAFLLGATFSLPNALIGLGLLHSIRRSSGLSDKVRSRLWQAYQRGQAAQFDPDSWQPETLWAESLETIQRQFAIAVR
ncbi:MAG: Coq4 family protein [Thainema sp.]